MSAAPVVTRFAPSPTGELHLGNARTALFSWLLARHHQGRFVLRIEDTDAERSREAFTEILLADLRWLGLDWDAGPDSASDGDEYRQSKRGAIYARYFNALAASNHLYECYCTPLELELSRKAQLAAGRPPRYAGTCRELSAEVRNNKRAAGIQPTLRFRVPAAQRVRFTDLVHGEQDFLSDDIGDFIVRRADGSAAFFFCNAIDDALMGVTHVLRGEDHLTNSPRQVLLLDALALPKPVYAHVSLLIGADGSPLSKRHGAASVRDLRERGYLPAAVVNHLFRLGHSSSELGVLPLRQLARAFDVRHLGRAPARFEESQLNVWQRHVAHHLSIEESDRWLAAAIPEELDGAARRAFVEAVRLNVSLPREARDWADTIFGAPPALDAAQAAIVREAGPPFFSAAADALAAHGADSKAVVSAIQAATGKKGGALWKPLRLALTGRADGPEFAPLLRAIPLAKAEERLRRFAS
jgi:glutamyl-tRNA synthetase